MTTPWALAINPDRIAQATVLPMLLPALAPGQTRLAVRRFALTANNTTYAAFGRTMRYWEFFPSGDGTGRLPVWGFAEVVESRAEGLAEGARLWGFLPAASHLTLLPGALRGASLIDAAPHRADLPAVYNRYTLSPAGADPRQEAVQALVQPLFLTAFLLALHLAETRAQGARVLTLTSASSKTALALAWLLRQAPLPGLTVEGLTAGGNAATVAATGLYDRVVPYDALATLDPAEPRLIVDFAGAAAVTRALHGHLGAGLAGNIRVGGAHWADSSPPQDLPGPRPRFFFAPDHLRERLAAWGPARLQAEQAQGWDGFARVISGLLTIRTLPAPAALPQAWADLAAGRIPADTGLIAEG